MSFSCLRSVLLPLGLILAGAGAAAAQEMQSWPGDWQAPQNAEEALRFSGGVGIIHLQANELVYSGSSTLSHLIWQSTSPMIEVTAESEFSDGWYMRLSAAGAMGGDGYMEDYDWIAPFAPSDAFDDWSHRSQHPDTRLDHYISAGLRGGKRVLGDATNGLGLHAEAGVTDVQWSAYSGSYLYSVGGFRDTSGSIADGTLGITYRQTFPVVMAGVDFTTELGPLRLSGAAQGGLSVFARGLDDHWLRDLQFVDTFDYAYVAAADIRADYMLTEQAGLYVAASVQKVFRAQGNTEVVDTTTGTSTSFANAAGIDFLSYAAKAGLAGSF